MDVKKIAARVASRRTAGHGPQDIEQIMVNYEGTAEFLTDCAKAMYLLGGLDAEAPDESDEMYANLKQAHDLIMSIVPQMTQIDSEGA